MQHVLLRSFSGSIHNTDYVPGKYLVREDHTQPAADSTVFRLHIELIGHPDGVTIEDDVLCFRDCEVFVWQ